MLVINDISTVIKKLKIIIIISFVPSHRKIISSFSFINKDPQTECFLFDEFKCPNVPSFANSAENLKVELARYDSGKAWPDVWLDVKWDVPRQGKSLCSQFHEYMGKSNTVPQSTHIISK